MNAIKTFLILLVLLLSVSAVSAEGNFTALQEEIDSSADSIEITQNYIYDNSSDYELNEGILINKSDFTINGNGHTIDGAGEARIFYILGKNVTILNLNLINGFNEEYGGAIFADSITCKNISFVNNSVESMGGSIYCNNINLTNCEFSGNTAQMGAGIFFTENGTILDSNFIDNHNYTFSLIYGMYEGNLFVDNCTFMNLTSSYAPAIFSSKKNIIRNSFFINLEASLTGGAVAFKFCGDSEFENCLFFETSSGKNGGAIFADVDGGSIMRESVILIKNSTFVDSFADFGGAILQLGGILKIVDSNFINNYAIYSGGAIYTSNVVDIELNNSQISLNTLINNDYRFSSGGFYCEAADNVNITNSTFKNNSKNAVYSYDVSSLVIENSTFLDNGEAIHSVFTEKVTLRNNSYGNDTIFLNDTDYPTVIIEKGAEIEHAKNIINVTTLPSRFDSRDWGWVSPVENQGWMGACWTFGTCGALESTLLKLTGKEYLFSENNMQNSMLQYAKYGVIGLTEGGEDIIGLEYLLGWFGAVLREYDSYDELGKISPLLTTDENIHIQDVIFIDSRENATDNDAIKKAIMECGSLVFLYHAENDAPYYNEETHSQYQNYETKRNHGVSIVGWDDNFSKSNFLITPPGDGAFIVKNSAGTDWGENGFFYLSYYDTSILSGDKSIGFLMKNSDNYTKIYQRDLSGFMVEKNNYTSYKTAYTSIGNDLISGVGTYFRENENYTLEIYINEELKYRENGTAPFYGYHTLRLKNAIQVRENDNFTVLMKKEFVPIFGYSRLHFEENTTFAEINGKWTDLTSEDQTVTLKVYTKDLVIYTEDLVKIYKNDSNFIANVGVSNTTVNFEINGVNYTRLSDENGTAKMSINLNPGNYTIKTTFNGTTVENTITVLPTLIAENLIKYYRNASQFYITLIDGQSNAVSGRNITMNINGVFYDRLTNENGTAKLNINLEPGEYILTAIDPLTRLTMSYNITVLPVLNATDLEMNYMDGSTFNATVLDGQGNPLADAKITFNINGVFYTRTTDSSGIAKLNIRLMAGEYIITSEYDGMRIANTITIKD